jgi:hypothetical protein
MHGLKLFLCSVVIAQIRFGHGKFSCLSVLYVKSSRESLVQLYISVAIAHALKVE